MPEQGELMLLPSRSAPRRRRTRRPTITTLPDHARQQLVDAFANVDIAGTGRVERCQLVQVVKEVYQPTEDEVRNVQQYFSTALDMPELLTDEPLNRQRFSRLFEYTVLPVLSSSHAQALNWSALLEIFQTSISHLARHGSIQQPSSTPLPSAGALQLHDQELDHLYQNISSSRDILREMVRQSFVLPPRKLDQLALFFRSSKDDRVTLDQFIHGMTLLYGDMKLLLSHQPDTAASLKRPQFEPLHSDSPQGSPRWGRSPRNSSLDPSTSFGVVGEECGEECWLPPTALGASMSDR